MNSFSSPSRPASPRGGSRAGHVRLLALSALLLSSVPAAAHDFTAAIVSVGEGREQRLAEAVRGFLLAADERDGHANETSDGHLGGVDVHILPLPPEAAGKVEGLSGKPGSLAQVVVVIGPDKEAANVLAGVSAESAVLRPGTLPPLSIWAEATATESFAVRYRKTYGSAPTEAAAEGYNAARRIDIAVRPLDGTEPRDALVKSLSATEGGIDW